MLNTNLTDAWKEIFRRLVKAEGDLTAIFPFQRLTGFDADDPEKGIPSSDGGNRSGASLAGETKPDPEKVSGGISRGRLSRAITGLPRA